VRLIQLTARGLYAPPHETVSRGVGRTREPGDDARVEGLVRRALDGAGAWERGTNSCREAQRFSVSTGRARAEKGRS